MRVFAWALMYAMLMPADRALCCRPHVRGSPCCRAYPSIVRATRDLHNMHAAAAVGGRVDQTWLGSASNPIRRKVVASLCGSTNIARATTRICSHTLALAIVRSKHATVVQCARSATRSWCPKADVSDMRCKSHGSRAIKADLDASNTYMLQTARRPQPGTPIMAAS